MESDQPQMSSAGPASGDKNKSVSKKQKIKNSLAEVHNVSTLNRATQYRRHIEPTVLSIELLRSLVIAQGPKTGFAQILAEEEGIPFENVTQLRLDFCNIEKIQCLGVFTNLEKLNLDNNVINTIEGLDELNKLTWLDLSSNNIKKIQGIENLTELQSFCISNNKIDKLDGIFHLKKLEAFSIAHNKVEEIRELRPLYTLKNLHTVHFTGNPVCRDKWYRWTLLAFITNLKYLDYKQLAMRNSAMEKKIEQEKFELWIIFNTF